MTETDTNHAASAPDAAALLADLPARLWGGLSRALRRAVEGLSRSELPAGLRPFAGWKPERLLADRPRRAAARALAADPRLRELVGEAMDDRAAYAAAADADPRRLVDDHGEETAVAALVARGRWDAVAVLAAATADRLAAQNRAAAEAQRDHDARGAEATRRRLADDLAVARRERDVQRRRADAAEQRLREDADQRRRLDEEVTRLRAETERLSSALAAEQQRGERRASRLQRRLDATAASARVDEARMRHVLADLDALTGRLRSALDPSTPDAAAQGAARRDAVEAPSGRAAPGEARAAVPAGDPNRFAGGAIPRQVAPAVAGRPCRLPPGIVADSPHAVRSLLQVPGIVVTVDGYNVSMDARGRPHASLEQQRQWLVALAAGVVGRHRCRVVLVFDGSEQRAAATPSPRGVCVVYTAGEETADDRIVALVAGLADHTPALVVSSDRQVRDDTAELGANIVAASHFLAAVGA